MVSPAEDGSIGRVPYRFVALFVLVFGTFMTALDTTVINLGLTDLQRDFDTVIGVEWVVTAYLAAVGVAQTTSGWASDRFGRKQMFVGALAVFTVSSLLCAIAPSLDTLIAARVLQGLAGGTLMPVVMAMIYELFGPEERGRALGWFGMAVMAAPTIGPVLGGALVSSFGWRWLFLINIPIGVVGVPVSLWLLRDTGFRERRPLDRGGLVLCGGGLAVFLVGLEQAASHGWLEARSLGFLVVGAVLLITFVFHARRIEHPLVDVRIFTNPIFALGVATIGLMSVAQFTRLVYVPLQLGSVRGISEFQIGLVMLGSAIGIVMTMTYGGRLADRIGAKLPATLGLSVMATSFIGLFLLTTSTPLPVIAAILFVGGAGAGLAMMPPSLIAMNSINARLVSQGSALNQMSRQMSAAMGTAVMASIFATQRPDASLGSLPDAEALLPYKTVFLVALVFSAVAAVFAFRLPGKERALELQRERRAEMEELGLADEPREPVYVD